MDLPHLGINGLHPQHHSAMPSYYANPMVSHQVQVVNGSLDGISLARNGRRYSLRVMQQPVRARMCGFGDKDRRPITPPPCVQLLVTDINTGANIDPSDVDSSQFVLTVDLWDENGVNEVNLVRHSNSSPAVSISAATTTPFPPPAERPFLGVLNSTQLYTHYINIGDHASAQNVAIAMGYHSNVPHVPQMYNPGGQHIYPQQSPVGNPSMSYPTAVHPAVALIPAPTAGMFTRNLIGSLSVNAFKLRNPQGEVGFWFILQDLSVRTEGSFRLKMNFVDVSRTDRDQSTDINLNCGKAPVLAAQFSEPFQVFSAKKFPGVIESTELSKAFASQGIKIPIRKDCPKVPNPEEYEADE